LTLELLKLLPDELALTAFRNLRSKRSGAELLLMDLASLSELENHLVLEGFDSLAFLKLLRSSDLFEHLSDLLSSCYVLRSRLIVLIRPGQKGRRSEGLLLDIPDAVLVELRVHLY
jgi:hypothetical protein